MADNPAGQLQSSVGIAALRWQVKLFRRDQAPGANSRIQESWHRLALVRADIQPTYPTTYYASAQIDTPITHLIRVRWADYVQNIHIITRTTRRPNDETYRAECFRLRRVKEVGGRKRFCELECELESVKTATSDTDAELESLFAENPAVLH